MDGAPDALSADRLRRARLHAQHLAPDAALTDPVAVARAVCGLQAQDSAAAALAVRVRTAGLTATDVAAAVESGRLVRTWLTRGTLHLVAAEDVRWLLALHGPVFASAARRRRCNLGFDDASAERAARLIHDVIADHGPLTRAEIAPRLAAANLPHEGQATIHAIQLAACLGLVCCGPPRAGKSTYVRLDERVTRLSHCHATRPWPTWPAATCAATARPRSTISSPGRACQPASSAAAGTRSPPRHAR